MQDEELVELVRLLPNDHVHEDDAWIGQRSLVVFNDFILLLRIPFRVSSIRSLDDQQWTA